MAKQRKNQDGFALLIVKCPCCGKDRNVRQNTPLLNLESILRREQKDPWQRSLGWSVEEARRGKLQWACSPCIVASRAIEAKPWLQKFCDFLPYFAYYDVELICACCERLFKFDAREQQFWYEELKFWVQSRPKHCVTCRKLRREQKEEQRRKSLRHRARQRIPNFLKTR